MAKIKFNGSVVTGNNKPVKTFDEAQRVIAECGPCGCDDRLGYFTMTDLDDDTVYMIFFHNGGLLYLENTAANRTLFAECCAERAAGTLSGTDCDALAAAASAVG